VGRRGAQLFRRGQPFTFTGVNAYQLATDFAVNYGCGQAVDLDRFFASVGPGRVVRTWLFQTEGVNRTRRAVDWTAVDRVVHAAERHGVLLVLVLGEQAGTCDDGHWHDPEWYRGGYRQRFDDNGNHTNVVSWWQWLHAVVPRYRASPAVAMWEPVNEPQTSDCPPPFRGKDCYGHGSCPGGNAELLRSWFDTVGAEIHRLDPIHLVASGTIGNGECGAWQKYYALMGASSGVDVLTVHDYDPAPLNPTMAQHIDQAREIGKPLVFEEVGTDGGARCALTAAARARVLQAKRDAVRAHPSVAGFLLWQWVQVGGDPCGLEFPPGDPALAQVAEMAHPEAWAMPPQEATRPD